MEGPGPEEALVEGDTVISDPLNGAGEDDVAMAKQRLLATLQRDDGTSEHPDLPSQAGANNGSLDPKAAQPDPTAISSTLPAEGSHPGPAVPHGTVGEEDEEIPLTTRISATLDMIVTIVGEEYGQKDLLDGRMMWE
ncbi:MAG: hypothetical protein LQ346_008855 [Caloplaca aetnensis]|nr:MAG: hypothetical protein LQ346_008855 [Caloplaca aetnensis]